MNLDEAMRKSALSFYQGSGFETLEKTTGKKVRHNKQFFDNYEKELLKKIKKSKKSVDDQEEIDEDAAS